MRLAVRAGLVPGEPLTCKRVYFHLARNTAEAGVYMLRMNRDNSLKYLIV